MLMLPIVKLKGGGSHCRSDSKHQGFTESPEITQKRIFVEFKSTAIQCAFIRNNITYPAGGIVVFCLLEIIDDALKHF